MSNQELFQLLAYTFPAIITAVIAYFFFKMHTENEEKRRRYLLHKEHHKDVLPLRLQAYERMALFLERIHPSKLLIRVIPFSTDKNDYERLLIHHIEQEFEHNLAQQIYISDECWTVINTAKSTTIQNIRRANMSEKVDSANKLREVILSDLLDKTAPSQTALSYVKSEVVQLFS
jgi:RNase H-fold protein (predicted Holliday junction resolvase)